MRVDASSSARQWTRETVVGTVWAACVAWALLAVVANITVEAVPHVRGIGFFPQLRYVSITSACLVNTLGAACLYRWLVARSNRPRWLLSGCLVAVTLVILALMDILGPPGLARAAIAPVVAVNLISALLVPRLVDRPPRRKWVVVTTGTLVFIEIFGVVAGLATEQPLTGVSGGSEFEIPRSMFDAQQRFIDLPSGARIHYVDVGSGETLLFLHGNPSWSFQWRELIGGLRGSFRCITLDYPGFGLSTAPRSFGYTPREESLVVGEFVEQLELQNVTLVMQDWGGPIGMGLAIRRPELIRRVVLGSTWAWRTSASEPRGQWSVIAGGHIGEFLQINFNGVVAAALNSGIVRQLPTDVAALYRRPFLPLDHRGIAAFYPHEITAADDYFRELEAGLGRVADKPALILWAGKDIGFPRRDLVRWERAFPDHKTIELPDANHFFFEDTAQQVIQEVRSFALK
ncbi:MAG: haloalkane dehalogenase [Gammaproteobacteria bacterium]|jgi:pimeloyl-ACP methyl ester carboxylesterase|nr:haloalkane dehalogenase [Gammaproteobacteria bacterium]